MKETFSECPEWQRFIFISSPEPKAHSWAYSIWRHPSSVVNIVKRLILWSHETDFFIFTYSIYGKGNEKLCCVPIGYELCVLWQLIVPIDLHWRTLKRKNLNSSNSLISCVLILLKCGNNNYQYVSKICSKFNIKIISNKKVTAYQIAIPLDFNVAIKGGLSSTKIYSQPENWQRGGQNELEHCHVCL